MIIDAIARPAAQRWRTDPRSRAAHARRPTRARRIRQVYLYLDDTYGRDASSTTRARLEEEGRRGGAARARARHARPVARDRDRVSRRAGPAYLRLWTRVKNRGETPVPSYEIGDVMQWGTSSTSRRASARVSTVTTPSRGSPASVRAELRLRDADGDDAEQTRWRGPTSMRARRRSSRANRSSARAIVVGSSPTSRAGWRRPCGCKARRRGRSAGASWTSWR